MREGPVREDGFDRLPGDRASAAGGNGAIITWIPVLVGVGILAGLLLAVLIWKPGDNASQDTTAVPPPAAPPVLPAEPQPPDANDGLGTGSGPAGRVTASVPVSGSGAMAPSRKASSPPPAPGVSGRYRVLSSFGDSFIGEVLVSNSTSSPRDWTVQLRFPSNVGDLRTSWLESQPQPTLTHSGPSYTFTSTVPVAARSAVSLRFQFDRSGRNNNPLACSTNGLTCSGL